jgi:DNA/RNA endonuclease YhcR with UshA esterase domain
VLRNILLASILMTTAAPIVAHHGDTNYDLSAPFSITGTVVQFRFINPHMQITLDVTDGDGKVTQWVAHGTSPNRLIYRGWSATVLKPGDKVTLNGNRSKNGSATMKFSSVLLDGKPIGD